MTTTDSTLTTRKQQKKAEIEVKYIEANKRSSTSLLVTDEITDTSTLAKQVDTAKFLLEGLTIKNIIIGPAICLLLIHTTQIVLLLFFGEVFGEFPGLIVIEVILSILAVICWSIVLNQGSKIIINRFSLNIIAKNLEIEWNNVITTHIRLIRGRNTTRFLIVNFYDPNTDDFKEEMMNLTYLKTNEPTLAAVIEYYKKLHTK